MKKQRVGISMKKSILRSKKVLWVAVISFLLIIGFILLNLNYKGHLFVDASKVSLQALADEKASQVNTFLESQKEKLEVLSNMNVFIEAAKYPNDSEKVKSANESINELKDIVPGITITTPEGIVIIAENDFPGEDYSGQKYYSLKEKRISFERYYDPLRKGDYYAVVGPIYDNTNKNKIIGTIVFDIELSEISNIMKGTAENVNSEVYLIEGSGLLLSDSKYIGRGNKNGVLIQDVHSDGAQVCLDDLKKYGGNGSIKSHEDNVFKYVNYMGNEVDGAHAYVPAIGGCVLAEENLNGISRYSMSGYIANIFKKEVK
jgi:hypothetical protein